MLPIEIIHGAVNWALLWATVVTYACEFAPQGSDARMQAAVRFFSQTAYFLRFGIVKSSSFNFVLLFQIGVVYWCFGPAIGGVLFGILTDILPWTSVYVYTGIALLIMQAIWNGLGWYWRGQRWAADRPSQALLGSSDWPQVNQ